MMEKQRDRQKQCVCARVIHICMIHTEYLSVCTCAFVPSGVDLALFIYLLQRNGSPSCAA